MLHFLRLKADGKRTFRMTTKPIFFGINYFTITKMSIKLLPKNQFYYEKFFVIFADFVKSTNQIERF